MTAYEKHNEKRLLASVVDPVAVISTAQRVKRHPAIPISTAQEHRAPSDVALFPCCGLKGSPEEILLERTFRAVTSCALRDTCGAQWVLYNFALKYNLKESTGVLGSSFLAT